MQLRRISAAGTPPVTLDEAKARLRVTYDTEDPVITAMIAAACDVVGEKACRVLAAETWQAADFSLSGAVILPKSPVTALVSVTWLDAAEAVQTATLSDYSLVQTDDWSTVQPKAGKTWPTALADRPDAVRVQFTAGYTTLPAALKEAVLLMVGHLFRNREGVVDGVSGADLPLSIQGLIDFYRLKWFG